MSKLNDVNTTDIRDAIRLGCRTMCNVFNADDNDIPFMGSCVYPEARLSFGAFATEGHVPGRHLNALLNAKDAAGVELGEECIEKHARAAFISYSGPVPLPLDREVIDGPRAHLFLHSIREGFHALYALVKYRRSARARELAEASIAAIFEYWDPGHGWDLERLEAQGLKVYDTEGTFITQLARAIGPVVKYYRATGHEPALELAVVLKEKAVAEFFIVDGQYDREKFGTHGHSTTCVMSSLAQLADLTRDSHLMGQVKAFYDNGLWDMRDKLGWAIESTSPDKNPDRGEGNNTGDIVETALILGHWGYTEYYADAERILRGHLLPAQLRDISFIVDPPNPKGEDGKRDVANRHLGAFGFPAPYGHQPIGIERFGFAMDIVGGVVGSLCEAYREVTRFDAVGHWVNLLFDHETGAIEVESPYTHPALCVRIKRPGPLFVRVPPWVVAESIAIQGTTEVPRYTNGYLFLAQPPVNRPISFEFPFVEQEITLEHSTRRIRARLRGDEVVAMDNFGVDLTFFDPID